MSEVKSSTMNKTCEFCKQGAAKYKCPACDICTCSLECVKEHKIKRGCSGIRNRVKMIEKEDMDNLALLSDYRFLEEIDHKLEDGARNPLRKQIANKEMFADLPPHLKRLKTEARKRGTVIEFMPQHFLRHTQNSTRYNYREGKIRWHIKWVFPQADVSFVDKSVSEDQLIVHLLRKYLEPRQQLDDNDSDEEEVEDKISMEDSDKLQYYQSASYRRVAVLLKCEMCLYDDRFVEMFLSRSLKDNLTNRKIVEHPVFYVVLKDHLDAFLEDKPDYGFKDLLQEADSLDGKQSNDDNFNSNTSLASAVQTSYQSVNTLRVRRAKEGLSFFDDFSDDSD